MIIMEKGNVYIGIGLISNSLGIILRRNEGIFSTIISEHISCFLQGTFTGLGIVLIFLGYYYEKNGNENKINFKKKIFKKILGKM